jgi:hypothetical protein
MSLLSRLLWTIAIVVGLFAIPAAYRNGMTADTARMWLVSFVAGVLGGLVDLIRKAVGR